MGNFLRAFDTPALCNWDHQNPRNLVRQLFEQWALPGHATSGDRALRLGLRNGYINFYVKGQSVAKLSFSRNGPTLAVHSAYFDGRARTKDLTGSPASQKYVTIKAETLTKPSANGLVETWVKTAETYASAEKRFVDDLVAANPGVVDMEMGLPASDFPGEGERVAPRMDLVVVQSTHNRPFSIAFWEAKCADNGELRARAEYRVLEDGRFEGPRVLNQIHKYVRWMNGRGRNAEVRHAYRAAANCMLRLHDHFCSERGEQSECLAKWGELSERDDVVVIAQPGIVVGNYLPERCGGRMTSQEMEQAARTFDSKGHRDALKRNGLVVHEVGANLQDRHLPRLESRGTRA